MPRFLTPEWVEAFNETLQGVVLPAPGPDAGLAAANGVFTIAQQVRGTPDGDVRLVLHARAGAVTLSVAPLEADADPADVTVALDYADAVALADGSSTPAEALTAGRIRVRGDLSVLTAGQDLLVAARDHTRSLDIDTTF